LYLLILELVFNSIILILLLSVDSSAILHSLVLCFAYTASLQRIDDWVSDLQHHHWEFWMIDVFSYE